MGVIPRAECRRSSIKTVNAGHLCFACQPPALLYLHALLLFICQEGITSWFAPFVANLIKAKVNRQERSTIFDKGSPAESAFFISQTSTHTFSKYEISLNYTGLFLFDIQEEYLHFFKIFSHPPSIINMFSHLIYKNKHFADGFRRKVQLAYWARNFFLSSPEFFCYFKLFLRLFTWH